MARKIEIEIIGDASKLRRELDRSEGSIKGVTGRFGGMAKAALIAGGAAGIGAVVVGAKKAVDAASNLGESVNAVQVVFGKASKQVLDFSEKAATKAGLSMREFNELVTPVGASLINTGFSADEAAKASINLAQRAADMASVFNTDVGEALGAIQAGLRGEADPLERFGVGLSDARVKAQALKMGLADTEAALTAQDKAQARLALVMKDTDRVSGDFANTSGSLANQQRILKADLENAAAAIGQRLIPAVTEAFKFVRSTAIPAVRELGNWLNENLVPAVGAVSAKVQSDLLPRLQEIANRINNTTRPAFDALLNSGKGAILGLVTVGEENRQKIGNIFANLETIVGNLAHAFDPLLKLAVVRVVTPVTNLLDLFAKSLKPAFQIAIPIIEKATAIIAKMSEQLDKVRDAIDWLISHIPKVPKFPDIDVPFVGKGRGDASGMAVPGAAFGPASVSPSLYDELAGAQQFGLSLTSGYRPGAITKHGTPSDHGVYPSKAIDVAGSPGAMAGFFRWLIGQKDVKQAFYDPLGSIFGGVLSSYREGGHLDHVHVASFGAGGMVPGSLGSPQLILAHGGETVLPTHRSPMVVQLVLDGKVLASQLIDPLQDAAASFSRNNAMGAFA